MSHDKMFQTQVDVIPAFPLLQDTAGEKVEMSRQVGNSKTTPATSLKGLADYLGLSPGTISVVLNRVPRASEIPQKTQERIFAAAKKLNYRPDHTARTLKSKRSRTIGILAPEISEGYGALLLNAIGEYLIGHGYFYFVATHGRRPDLLAEYPRILVERAVEGFILIDTALEKTLPLPAVAISGHRKLSGLTNVVLDHDLAAKLAIDHLVKLGHRKIAFMKGQEFSADSYERWRGIQQAAKSHGIQTSADWTFQLTMPGFSPEVSYPLVQQFLKRKKDFTALFAYNDFSAIGAVRALRDAGFRVPEDISVVGFDDVNSAAFQNPSLTTVRQPLKQMAEIAAQTLLDRLAHKRVPREILVAPELVVRESTGPCSRRS